MLPLYRKNANNNGYRFYEYGRIALTLMEVYGDDGNIYTCSTPHYSTNSNRPVSGVDYATYWQLGGSIGGVWVGGVTYGVSTTPTYRKVLEYDVYFRAVPGASNSFVNSDGTSKFIAGLDIKIWNPPTNTVITKNYKALSSSQADILAIKNTLVQDIVEEGILKYSTNITAHRISVLFSGNIYDTQQDGPALTDKSKSIVCMGFNTTNAAITSYDNLSHIEYNAFKLLVGVSSGSDSPVIHEFLHCMGFGHTFDGNNTPAYKYMPMLYGISDNGYAQELLAISMDNLFNRPSPTEDAISSMDYLYSNTENRVSKIFGYAGDCFQDSNASAYIINANTNEILYEAPVDVVGYYEFNFRTNPGLIKIFLVSSGFGANSGVYRTINYYLSGAFTPTSLTDAGNHIMNKVVRCDARFKLLRNITKIKLMIKTAG